MAEQKFSYESVQDACTIKDIMQSLIDGIGRRRVLLATENDEIVLTPVGMLKVSLKARKKNDKNSISLKIAWENEKSPAHNNSKVTISS